MGGGELGGVEEEENGEEVRRSDLNVELKAVCLQTPSCRQHVHNGQRI